MPVEGGAGWGGDGNVWHAHELKFYFYAFFGKKKLGGHKGCQFPMEETPLTCYSYNQNLKGKKCFSSFTTHWVQLD